MSTVAVPPKGDMVEIFVLDPSPEYLQSGSDILFQLWDHVVVR